jgi:hypothetical protein
VTDLCGRRGGYHRHVIEGTEKCSPCREAERAAKERWRKRSYLNHGPLVVDATGTRRRIQALARIGWSSVEIGRRVGVECARVSYLTARKTVHLSTAQRIAALYDELSMLPGPSITDGVMATTARTSACTTALWTSTRPARKIEPLSDEHPKRSAAAADEFLVLLLAQPHRRPDHRRDLEEARHGQDAQRTDRRRPGRAARRLRGDARLLGAPAVGRGDPPAA